jgi:threonylcarbamoyladenosine tRNA methylthiotransferase MtaB
MRAVVFNLGCKVNQYESDKLAQGLRQKGFEVFSQLVFADIYIINTCAVTAEAERKSRQAVKRCLSHNPDGRVFVCGCASQRDAAAFEKKKAEYVCGADKGQLLDKIETIAKNENANDAFSDRTRAFVKIQDGCDNFCSYCIIPHLRGRSVSRDIDEIVKEISNLAQKTKEIVITGINLALFGKDNGTSLTQLIKAISRTDVRIRLGSFYVEGLTKELLTALFSLKKFCPHFHLSLQSGDDCVLKAMRRRYSTTEYLEKIDLIRSFDKNAAITTDIIVGFPTETDEQFENTVNFVKQAGFSDIHIFPFSAREGTAAAKLPPLPKQTLRSRAAKLAQIKNDLQKRYLNNNIGVVQQVLFEEEEDGIKSGYSERYIKVYASTEKDLAEIVPTEIYKDGLKGEENG